MCEQHVHTMRVPMTRNREWSAWLLLMADVHWDNPLCRRDMVKRHLDEARERGARVMVFGDLFCAMQGRYDPRGHKVGVRPEHQRDDYLDALVDTAAAWWAPYGDLVELVTPGNHESALLKRLETDITRRFVDALRDRHGSGVEAGTYQGWVRMLLEATDSPYRQQLRLRYHHGHGGGGVVTKGTLWPQRRAAWWPDADIVVSGHIHEQWSFPIVRERITTGGRVYTDTQLHLQLPTYKPETVMGGGWAVEKGMSPRPLGAWWVRLWWDRHETRVQMTETRAA